MNRFSVFVVLCLLITVSGCGQREKKPDIEKGNAFYNKGISELMTFSSFHPFLGVNGTCDT